MKQIIVTIEEDGKSTVDVVGVKGKECAKLAQPIIDALGVATETKIKPEFHQQAALKQQVGGSNG